MRDSIVCVECTKPAPLRVIARAQRELLLVLATLKSSVQLCPPLQLQPPLARSLTVCGLFFCLALGSPHSGGGRVAAFLCPILRFRCGDYVLSPGQTSSPDGDVDVSLAGMAKRPPSTLEALFG